MPYEDHPRPVVTVDVIVFALHNYELRVLLIRRKNAPFAGMWALPGGFVDIGEALEAAAWRELEEETGLRDVYLEQLYTFGDIGRDPRGRVITVAYLALLPSAASPLRAGSDASAAQWWPVHNLPPLAFDHAKILTCALQKLRYKLGHTAIASALLPETFTLRELQATYEAILGRELDRRVFRRNLLAGGIIEATGAYRSEGGRPVRLYRFRPDAVAELKRCQPS
ncbi:MAG: NUDIX hydrolase [Anaerolineae bacterium]|nr:NUDIX hydrolase [Anaerolineae bacterium]